jgi:hypothetical protein
MAEDILDTRLGEALCVVATDTELRRGLEFSSYTLTKENGERWVISAVKLPPAPAKPEG